MNKLLSLITKFPATRHDRELFTNRAVEEIINGTGDPLQIDIRLKNLEEVVKDIRSSTTVKYAVQREADKYPEKSFERYGAKITKTSRREWNYDDCNDTTLTILRQDLLRIQSLIKERESFLQTLKPGMLAVDENTGEQLFPPVVLERSILQISIL